MLIESATLTINYDLQNQTDYNDYRELLRLIEVGASKMIYSSI